MKKIILVLVCLLLCSSFLNAQILTPVKVSTSTKSLGNNEYQLNFDFRIEPKFHVYSQHITNDGPVPTSFTFEKSADYELIGEVKEVGKMIEEHDPNFDMMLKYFETQVSFQQKVKLKKATTKIKVMLEYMTCDDKQCLPPKSKEYVFDLAETKTENKIENKNDNKKTDTGVVKDTATKINSTASIDIANKNAAAVYNAPKDYLAFTDDEDATNSAANKSAYNAADNWWIIFLKGMAAGLLALLMPCVFPMIPLTVSFFTKRSTTRKKGLMNALTYGFSIIFMFVLLGFLVGNSLNQWASSALFNLLFFVIFVIFAISFFGAFEITLPNSWIQKSDQASERGGFLGTFFMAFTMVLVSFSCTGPFIALMINEVSSAGGSKFNGAIGMFGFSFAFSLPFMFFAFFPGWLQTLPKSGSWMNTVKVTFGFIELAAALKFLSNVDMAYHWNILPREWFLVFWIVIFALMAIYLMGWIRFAHDSPMEYLSVPRLLSAVLTFAFAIYMVPGLWGAPLKLISGFPPPEFYKEWKTNTINGSGGGHNCPHNLNCYHDYEEALKAARTLNKPLFVDFTGWSCVNCRKMEEKVWSDEKVLKQLHEDYVVVSLYVDDREKIAAAMQRKNYDGETITTTGGLWTDMQIARYKANAQPFYVLLDNNENLINRPSGANFNIDEYAAFLEKGKSIYKKRNK